MSVSRLRGMAGIGVDRVGDLADRADSAAILRLENLDTDLIPSPGIAAATHAATIEYRMIGWRIGWIVAPPRIINDLGLVTISNVVCPVGIAQAAARVALNSDQSDVAAARDEWQRRRDCMLAELSKFAVVKPQGGWSLLMDCRPLGLTGAELSERLLSLSQIAATPMTGWGSPRSADFIRFVFANEPVARLHGLGERVARALGSDECDQFSPHLSPLPQGRGRKNMELMIFSLAPCGRGLG